MSNKTLVEACVDSLQGALAAAAAGADRIELNFALSLEGLTPSIGLVERVLESVQIPVIAMIRPRAGDFQYSPEDWQVMLRDTQMLKNAGVAGIAFGAVQENMAVDVDRCREIFDIAGDLQTVFHKAFDVLADWETGLEQLVEIGVDRVMTSGRVASSLEGIPLIHQIQSASAGRIGVLPAGGVNRLNAREIVAKTGVNQVHGSFSSGNPRDFVAVENEIRQTIDSVNL